MSSPSRPWKLVDGCSLWPQLRLWCAVTCDGNSLFKAGQFAGSAAVEPCDGELHITTGHCFLTHQRCFVPRTNIWELGRRSIGGVQPFGFSSHANAWTSTIGLHQFLDVRVHKSFGVLFQAEPFGMVTAPPTDAILDTTGGDVITGSTLMANRSCPILGI